MFGRLWMGLHDLLVLKETMPAVHPKAKMMPA